VLLIATYTRPFTGDISVGPELLQQVITSKPTIRILAFSDTSSFVIPDVADLVFDLCVKGGLFERFV
jgi:hypothetical protein